MSPLERAGLAAIRGLLDPETAHHVALMALRAGLTPRPGPVTSPRLATRLAGLELPNPVGLAAGFDKNAQAVVALSRTGFGFIEVGAATPRPQPGNPRPRLFRLDADHAAINRFGFNNEGIAAIATRLAAARGKAAVPVGLNVGANKDSPDRAGDYAAVIAQAADVVDFVTINVSSPNTERLRELQGAAALDALLGRVMAARDSARPGLPVFLKVAPDLSRGEIADIAGLACNHRLDALIATNTTLAREGLTSPLAAQAGGLSGRPLFERSTRVLAAFAAELKGALPLIGVGGVDSAQTALAKIEAGASAVQLYTALVFGGFSLAGRIARDLDRLLAARGYAHVSEAVGRRMEDWL